MKSASTKTYISKRQMDKYREMRAQRQSAKAQQQPFAIKKQFAEDEEEKKEDQSARQQPPQVQMQAASASVENVTMVEPNEGKGEKTGGFFSSLKSAFTFGSKKDSQTVMVVNERRNSLLEMDRNLSCEEMDSDDLGGDLNLSDNEDGAQDREVRRNFKKQRRVATNAQAGVYRQEFDTNVFEVKLDCLAEKGQLATGDAEICSKCQAVFNKFSVLTEKDDNQIWKCEFCTHENEVMIGEEEIPQTPQITYLLEAPAQVQDAAVGGNAAKDISIVFCLDISGSMCVTQPVKGKHAIKGDKLNDLAATLRQFGDGSDQFLNQSDRGMTYVSRIQCVKAAIDSQINDMANGAGERKLGIVAFNHEVQVIGDGTLDSVTITGDHLNNFEHLQNNGKTQAGQRLTKPVSETKDILKAKLEVIEETGPTALGPGILTAVAMAAEGSAGSSVVICTDGLANIGLGAWDECHTEADTQAAQAFYERIGQIASTAGVTISIVSIEGDECNLEALSSLAEVTGGKVERVSPTTLTQDFANMLAMPVMATQVEAKVKLHKGLQFRNELPQDLSEDKSLLARRFGNTTAETVFTFEYGMKAISQLLEMENIDMSALSHFPFQTQIQYTALDGSKCLLIITKQMEVSGERDELNNNANATLMQKNCVMKGTAMARAGNIRGAQAIMKGFKRQAQKQMAPQQQSVVADQFVAQCNGVYGMMNNAADSDGEEELDQVVEQSRGMSMMQQPEMQSYMGARSMPAQGRMQSVQRSMMSDMQMEQNDMSDEAAEECMMQMRSAPKKSSKSKSKATTQIGGKKRLNDDMSAQLYKMSKF